MNRLFVVVLMALLALPAHSAPQAKTSQPPRTNEPERIPLAMCGESGPWSVTAVSGIVYWTNYAAGTVLKIPLAGGTATTLASGQHGPCGIASDGIDVYWTNSLDGTVMRMPAIGGLPIIIAGEQHQPSAITVGPHGVFWMTADGATMADMDRDGKTQAAEDYGDAGGGTNPGTVKCHVCPDYCTRFVPDQKGGHFERYICGWHSCPPCGA